MFENFRYRRNRLSHLVAARLSRLPMGRHPAFFVNLGLEGYRDYVFGARAGPSQNITNLFHELAHAAQFGPDEFRTRALVSGFSFRVPQVFVYNRYCCEPVTNKATQRELETIAYQLHLMQAAGCRVSPQAFFDDQASALKYMPDWYNVPGEDEEDRHAYYVKQIEAHYARLDPLDALHRLELWLDKTRNRVKRSKAVSHAPVTKYQLNAQNLLESVA